MPYASSGRGDEGTRGRGDQRTGDQRTGDQGTGDWGTRGRGLPADFRPGFRASRPAYHLLFFVRLMYSF
jgi:hypothetical protein